METPVAGQLWSLDPRQPAVWMCEQSPGVEDGSNGPNAVRVATDIFAGRVSISQPSEFGTERKASR